MICQENSINLCNKNPTTIEPPMRTCLHFSITPIRPLKSSLIFCISLFCLNFIAPHVGPGQKPGQFCFECFFPKQIPKIRIRPLNRTRIHLKYTEQVITIIAHDRKPKDKPSKICEKHEKTTESRYHCLILSNTNFPNMCVCVYLFIN